MNYAMFQAEISSFLRTTQPGAVITEIPAGSSVFHVANVPASAYSPTWVSCRPGRFSPEGPVKYFATNFDICTCEIGFPPGSIPSNVVFEAGETTTAFTVIDVHRLPDALKNELFADKNPDTKWYKSDVFMDIIKADARFSGVAGVYYPSASGQMLQTAGSCLLLTSETRPISISATGDYSFWKSPDAGSGV